MGGNKHPTFTLNSLYLQL